MRLAPRALAVAAASLLLPPSLVVIAPVSPASAATAPRYTITELGTLPGGDASFANAINNAGVVVGYATDGQYGQRAVKWANGTLTDLGMLPGGYFSQANAINDSGQVAGHSTRQNGGYAYPVRWSASGVIQDLGGPISNRLGSGLGIDPAGRVVGGQRPGNSEGNMIGTWYDTAGTMSELGTPPDSLGAAYGVNAKDQIVGVAPAYLWQKGRASSLPVLPGAGPFSAAAYAINISGQIVGQANTDAVLWQGATTSAAPTTTTSSTTTSSSTTLSSAGGSLTDLGTLDGIQYSSARAINAAGQVVGEADPQCSPCVSAAAWIWQPGTAMTRLDTLLPAGSGWTLLKANGINDAGQIVGSGLHNGKQRGYLLTPKFHANVNFQTAGGRIPTGYVADLGAVYGARNGLSYGWNVDNSAWTRDRNDTVSADQRYETLIHLQKPGSASTWELAIPNGPYSVHVVSGDACCIDSVFRLNVEGVLALSGTPTDATHWFEKTVKVTVTDGRLTISNASGSSNNKLNYVDISSG